MTADQDVLGHVTPGGAPWRLDLAGATVHKLSVSDMDNNVYLLTCTTSNERLLVDAAAEPDRILDLLASTADCPEATLGQVVTTHQHWDHHRALREVVAATGATTLAGADDADDAQFFPWDALPPLAFDHAQILADARRALRPES